MEDEQLRLETGNIQEKGGRREYFCRFVKAGRVKAAGNRPSNLIMEPEALQKAITKGLFDRKAVFVDHAGWFEHPSLRNLAGVTMNSTWNEADQAVEGKIKFYSEAEELINTIDEILEECESGPDIGLSIVFWPIFAPRDADSDPVRIIDIRHVESVDLVFEPAADGRLLVALSRLNKFNQDLFEDLSEEAEMDQETLESNEWMDALSSTVASAIIANSDLPSASKVRLSQQTYQEPAEVTTAIENERDYLAKLTEANVVQIGGVPPRSPQISMGLTGIEQVQLAADALLAGLRPGQGVAPLSGIRELYTLLSGDYEMTGVFFPERIGLANVNCSTMAGLVANALNKRIVNIFQEYPRWWEAFVSEEDFNTLQEVKWITLGGVGELPTVAEGAAYTELTWDDQTETATFVKKGGYLGLTLEAIDKDDTRRIQSAPRALAQAAWLTLAKAISYIFTQASGTGPLLADGGRLFNATAQTTTGGHANLGTTALSFTTYVAARTAMRKMSELNSTERLGALTAPKFLLVPPDLEITALQVLATEQQPAQANYLENPFAQGNAHEARMNAARNRVIVIDLWTDTNDWAAVADSRLYPTIGLAYRYGRTPEIFSVASPTAGLMFTNDTMPIKVRYFFATGPMDYRGLYKANVT
jgi:hypothetical protein